MKAIFTILFIFMSFFTLKAQNCFQASYPFFKGEANGEVLFTQSDGYVMAGIGVKDKYYLILIKTNLLGDTVWVKNIDLGLTSMGSCLGTSDESGNMYISIYRELVKIDSNGNLLWIKPSIYPINALKYNGNNIWVCTSGEYLYKINPSNGDSVWRSNQFAGSSSRTTSLTVNNSGVLMAVSEADGYTGWLSASRLFYLSNSSDSVINIPFNTGVNLVIEDTEILNDEYFSVGCEAYNGGSQNKNYLINYNVDGSIEYIQQLSFPYLGSGCNNIGISSNQLILMGNIPESSQSEQKVLLHCRSLDGDSLWTTLNGLNDQSVMGFDLMIANDGGYAVSGAILSDSYNIPYLLKTNSFGVITGMNLLTKPLDIVAYPNPSSDKISINTDGYLGGKIKIYSLEGKSVFESSISYSKTIISTKSFDKGAYLIFINSKSKIGSGKLIVQ